MSLSEEDQLLYNRFHGDFWKHSSRAYIFFYALLILFIGISPWEPDAPFNAFIKSIIVDIAGVFFIYGSLKEIAFARDCRRLRDDIIRNPLNTLKYAEHKRFPFFERSRFWSQIVIMIGITIGYPCAVIGSVLEAYPLQCTTRLAALWSSF